MAGTLFGRMSLAKNRAVNGTFGGKAWITGKPRGDQNKTIIAFGDMIILLDLVDFSASARSYCCSPPMVTKNQDSPIRHEMRPAVISPRRAAFRITQAIIAAV
jgi:hypothetical protein